MDNHTATEQAYKNGYLKGYDKGLEDALDVTIVRCKDCKFFIEPTCSDGLCELDGNAKIIWRNEDFCSYGERR